MYILKFEYKVLEDKNFEPALFQNNIKSITYLNKILAPLLNHLIK